MATWLKFKLGKDWGHGNGEVLYVRADAIVAVVENMEHENESILDLSEGAGPYDVEGKPYEIVEILEKL